MGNFSKAILIASVALCLHISAFSQGISLKNREITVKEAMELLKEKSGYSFVFSSADVNTNKRISISTDKATIDDVVKQILQGQNNLTYEIQNKRIIVKKIQSGDKTKNKRIKAIGKVVDDAGEPSGRHIVRNVGAHSKDVRNNAHYRCPAMLLPQGYASGWTFRNRYCLSARSFLRH